MNQTLIWLHPLMQVVAAIIGLWALWQGWKRFSDYSGQASHLPLEAACAPGVRGTCALDFGGLGILRHPFLVRQHSHDGSARYACLVYHHPFPVRAGHGLCYEQVEEKALLAAPSPRWCQCVPGGVGAGGMLDRL